MPGILCPDHSFELVWRGGGHYEHVFPRSCHLDQQWACVTWLPRDNGEHWAVTKSTTILTTTKCMAPRNKEEHYPEVSGLTLLSEISVIECQHSSKERWTKPWDYFIFQGRTRIILTSCQFCLLIRFQSFPQITALVSWKVTCVISMLWTWRERQKARLSFLLTCQIRS